jgi:hypothetical protein
MKTKNETDEKKRADRSGKVDWDFWDWTFSQALGDPRDLWISDLDAVIRDRADNLLLIEIKRRDAEIKPYQLRNMRIIDALIKAGIKATGGVVEIEIDGRREKHKVTFHGAKLLQLSKDSFFNSAFKIDGDQVSPEELAQILSFGRCAQTATGSPESYEKPEKDATY